MLGHRQRLGGLALGDLDHGHGEAGPLEAPDHRAGVGQPDDRGVGDQRGAPADAERAQALADAGQGAGLDDDRVRVAAEVDGDDHGASPRRPFAARRRERRLIAGAVSFPGPMRWWRPAGGSTG